VEDINNAAIMHIASMIISDDEYASYDWNGISVVGIVNNGMVDVSGFNYDDAGKIVPSIPQNDDFMDELEEFQKLTQVPGENPWKAVLIQIKRADMSVHVQFEYDNASRWKVTAANLESMKEELRPK
jgi:hypothetical protein